VVDSICQDSYADTLSRIATELIALNQFTLNPAPANPAGITVRITGGRFGAAGVDLVYGRDFTVSGATLTIISSDKAPQMGEMVEIYFTI
jgi:hypothetical protein